MLSPHFVNWSNVPGACFGLRRGPLFGKDLACCSQSVHRHPKSCQYSPSTSSASHSESVRLGQDKNTIQYPKQRYSRVWWTMQQAYKGMHQCRQINVSTMRTHHIWKHACNNGCHHFECHLALVDLGHRARLKLVDDFAEVHAILQGFMETSIREGLSGYSLEPTLRISFHLWVMFRILLQGGRKVHKTASKVQNPWDDRCCSGRKTLIYTDYDTAPQYTNTHSRTALLTFSLSSAVIPYPFGLSAMSVNLRYCSKRIAWKQRDDRPTTKSRGELDAALRLEQ